MRFTRLKTTAVALLFGLTIAFIEPYPSDHYVALLALSTLFFWFVFAIIREPRLKRVWIGYGLATFMCFAVSCVWWWGAMHAGWWYPPQRPIIQQFIWVDGESAYDAVVSNLFLMLWLVVTAAFVAWQVRAGGRR